jgi:hypothetical protein
MLHTVAWGLPAFFYFCDNTKNVAYDEKLTIPDLIRS